MRWRVIEEKKNPSVNFLTPHLSTQVDSYTPTHKCTYTHVNIHMHYTRKKKKKKERKNLVPVAHTVIPTFQRLNQEDHEFKASFGYTVRGKRYRIAPYNLPWQLCQKSHM